MNKRIELFESAPISKAVLSFSIPMMLGMLVTVVYIFADTFFVAQTQNPNQVAAITVCMPIFLVCMALGNLFGVGGASYISRLLGMKDLDGIKKTSSFAFYSSLVIGLMSTVVMFIFMPQILDSIGTSPESRAYSLAYLSWIAAGAPAIVLSFALGQIVRSIGAAKEAMIGMMVGTILNIVLDPIVVIVMKLGVEGAAIATVISNLVSVIYYILLIIRKDYPLSLNLRDFSFNGHIIRNVLAIGVPSTLSELLMSASAIVLNNYAALHGDKFIAAIGISLVVVMVPSMLIMGLSQGVQPLIGYTFTANLHTRLKGILKFTLVIALGLSLSLAGVIFIFGSDVVMMFMNDKTVTQMGGRMVRMLVWSMPFQGVLFVLIMMFQALGKAKQSLALSIARQGIVFIPILVALHYLAGQDGIVLAQPVADVVSMLLAIMLFLPLRKAFNKDRDGTTRTGIRSVKN